MYVYITIIRSMDIVFKKYIRRHIVKYSHLRGKKSLYSTIKDIYMDSSISTLICPPYHYAHLARQWPTLFCFVFIHRTVRVNMEGCQKQFSILEVFCTQKIKEITYWLSRVLYKCADTSKINKVKKLLQALLNNVEQSF